MVLASFRMLLTIGVLCLGLIGRIQAVSQEDNAVMSQKDVKVEDAVVVAPSDGIEEASSSAPSPVESEPDKETLLPNAESSEESSSSEEDGDDSDSSEEERLIAFNSTPLMYKFADNLDDKIPQKFQLYLK